MNVAGKEEPLTFRILIPGSCAQVRAVAFTSGFCAIFEDKVDDDMVFDGPRLPGFVIEICGAFRGGRGWGFSIVELPGFDDRSFIASVFAACRWLRSMPFMDIARWAASGFVTLGPLLGGPSFKDFGGARVLQRLL